MSAFRPVKMQKKFRDLYILKVEITRPWWKYKYSVSVESLETENTKFRIAQSWTSLSPDDDWKDVAEQLILVVKHILDLREDEDETDGRSQT